MSVLHMLSAPSMASVYAAGYEIGTGRLVPTAAAVVGLASVVVGGLAAARSGRSGNARRGGVLALVAGLVSVVVGGVHAANAAGGLGTGNGLAGAVAAVALGAVGAGLGGLVLIRSRRAA
jgi:hypothetical protein